MHVTVVFVAGQPAPVSSLLDLAAASLVAEDITVERLEVPARGLPAAADESIADDFGGTAGALIESWRIARHLDAGTSPGDVVLVPDHRGAGGIFALEQVSRPPNDRRVVWTMAGGSLMLELLDVVGTIEGVEPEDVAAIDWEIVQYRESSAVLAIGDGVGTALADITDVTLLPVAPRSTGPLGRLSVIGLPEPVARRSHTFAALRGLQAPLESDASLRVVVSEADRQDEIWSGTTWSTMSGYLESFEGRIARGDPLEADTLVLGDRFSPPDAEVAEAVARGKTVIAPADSTTAALYPDAPIWTDEDSLARALTGAMPHPSPRTREIPQLRPVEAADRAWRISVGIPIYRDVRYLDECVRSILGQTQIPHEIVLYDDGSRSGAVSQAIRRWEQAEPDRIRTFRGPNRGVSAARNAILSEMTGDSFFLVDSDDVLVPDCLERCAVTMRWNPSLWAVATWTRFVGFYEAVEARPPFDRRVGARENPIVSTAALVDMEARDLGIEFVPDMAFLYCEDWYLWSRIVAEGGSIGLVPEPLVVHRAREDSGAARRSSLAHALGKARATAPLLTPERT
jgi:GT2 family glycosyltransferase